MPNNNPLENLPIDVGSRLQLALDLPRGNRDIARWLFSNRKMHFHPSSVIFKPESVNNYIVYSTHHDFVQDQGSSSRSTRISGSSRPPSRVRNPSRPSLTLMVPVERYGSTVVGYMLTASHGLDGQIYPFDINSGRTLVLHGRFAFNSGKKHLVCIQHNSSSSSTALYVLNWYHGNRRQRCHISIPNEEYSFERLPTTVKAMTVINEVRLGSAVPFPSHPTDGLEALEQEYKRNVEQVSQQSSRTRIARGSSSSTGVVSGRNGREEEKSRSSDRRTNVEGIWTDANVLGLHPNLLYDLSGQDQYESDLRAFGETLESQSSRRGRGGSGEGNVSSQVARQSSQNSVRGTSSSQQPSSSSRSRQSRGQPLFNMTTVTGSTQRRLRTTQVGPLTDSSIRESLDELKQCLYGSFFCPKLYHGTREIRSIGNLLSTLGNAPRSRYDLLRYLAMKSNTASSSGRTEAGSSSRNTERKDRNEKRQRQT